MVSVAMVSVVMACVVMNSPFMNDNLLTRNAENCDAMQNTLSVDGVIWTPIRHHSPQCSWQLKQLIEQHQPDVILIEGPSDGQAFIPYLSDPAAKSPLAIYQYIKTKSGDDTVGNQHFRSFMPFTAMSPEWVAIQSARAHDIACHFIDLPLQQRFALGAEQNDSEQDYDEQETSLYDDRLLAACLGHDFEPWWESHVESGLAGNDPDAFFKHVLQLCLLLRLDYTHQQAIDAETHAREVFMAQQIQQHRVAGQRCLVVCGGFHCLGIAHHLSAGLRDQITQECEVTDAGMHLIPYSLDRVNKAAGYSAGMPDSGYYAAIWQALNADSAHTSMADIHQHVHVQLASELVTLLRLKNQMVTLPDAIEVGVMSQRLGHLRGHVAGRQEFREAITSCFYKQAHDGTTSYLDGLIHQHLAGRAHGRLPKDLPIAPLVADFYAQCELFKLPLVEERNFQNKRKSKVKTLQIYRKPKHKLLSHLLHQLAFLAIDYAELTAGPDFVKQQDLSRVREIWSLTWRPEVEAYLVELSHLGHSLAAASLSKLSSQIQQHDTVTSQVTGLLQALQMGLDNLIDPLCVSLQLGIQQAQNARSLCEVFHTLSLCQYYIEHDDGRNLAVSNSKSQLDIESLLVICYQRICVRLPWLASPSDEYIAGFLAHLNMIASVSQNPSNKAFDGALFDDALFALLVAKPETHPQIRGVCCGILHREQQLDAGVVSDYFATAFSQSTQAPSYGGDFMMGYLSAAKAVFLASPLLLSQLSALLLSLDEESFLVALPALRLAFTDLSPYEVSQLIELLHDDGTEVISGDRSPVGTLNNALRLQQQFAPLYALWSAHPPEEENA